MRSTICSSCGTVTAGDWRISPLAAAGVEDGAGTVHVNVHVAGLTPGLHGIHIHAIAACGPTFAAAGPHYAQVFKSSADDASESVRLMYLLSIVAAVKSVRIANAYFVPDSLATEIPEDSLNAIDRREAVLVPASNDELIFEREQVRHDVHPRGLTRTRGSRETRLSDLAGDRAAAVHHRVQHR